MRLAAYLVIATALMPVHADELGHRPTTGSYWTMGTNRLAVYWGILMGPAATSSGGTGTWSPSTGTALNPFSGSVTPAKGGSAPGATLSPGTLLNPFAPGAGTGGLTPAN